MGKTDKDLPWEVYFERHGGREHAPLWQNGGEWHTKWSRRQFYKQNRARARRSLLEARKGHLDAADSQAVAESRHRNSVRYDWY